MRHHVALQAARLVEVLITESAVQGFGVIRDGFGGVTVPVTANEAVVHYIQVLEEVLAVQVLHCSKGTAAVGAEVAFSHERHDAFLRGGSIDGEEE